MNLRGDSMDIVNICTAGLMLSSAVLFAGNAVCKASPVIGGALFCMGERIMISKELFCKTIADIQEQDRKISEFDHALGKICDSAVVFDADNLYLAALLRILKEELDDRADTIEWWLYEDVRKCIWFDLEDGRRMRYDMPTAESLYDYLTLPFEQLPLEVES